MGNTKFRVWDKENQQMIYFTLGHLLSYYNDEFDYVGIADTPLFAIRNDIDTEKDVMQATGVRDLSDKEIYADDLVKVGSYKTGVVRYDNGSYYIEFPDGHKLALQDTRWDWLDVVGNVHEHPEMLEGSDG